MTEPRAGRSAKGAGRRAARTKAVPRRESRLTSVLRAVRNVNQLITREKDRDTLLRRACEILTETRGYRSAWIGLGDGTGRMEVVAESGIGEAFAATRAELECAGWPACAREALAGREIAVLHNPLTNCVQCPLSRAYRDSAALAAALRHGGRDYGVLVVALPRTVADDAEERGLFAEVAGDLGFALHALELEARHRAAAAREAHLKQVLLAIRNVNQLIVHEEDPQRLIERACANLSETLGYHNAWIALLDDDGRTVAATAAAGLDGRFEALRERLSHGQFPACLRSAMERDAIVVMDEPRADCSECPLTREFGGRAGFARRLAFEGRTYGFLAASVPAAYARDAEEQSLFDEVAGDLGFALHKIELQARLGESHRRDRAKLDAVLAPEDGLGALSLADVLDVPLVQRMLDDFHRLTGMCMAILDLQGRILVAAGWQDICTKFHRVHPGSRLNCIESDTVLSSGVAPGSFKIYRCKNHLWDIATPIMLGGQHAGNLFLGQFLFEGEEPDREIFRAQARQYGFDEGAYLAALDRLPRWSRERVTQAMTFFTALARQISDLSHGNIRLARSLSQRDALVARLAENEERLRLALKATNDVVWDWDIVGDSQRWNEAGAVVFGWTDIVEAPQPATWWVDRVHPEDRARVDASFFAAVNDPGADLWSGEYRFRKADGTYADVTDRGHILRDADGRAVRMIGAMLDITERKRAEEALRESEGRFRFLVDHSYDLIWTLRADGVLSYVSPSWKTRLGYEPASVVDRAFQPLLHPDDVAACETYMARILETRSALSGPRYRVRHADGSWRWHEAGMTPVYADDGSFMYFVGISRDITEHKRAEDALRSSRQLLEATEWISGFGGWEYDVAGDRITWTDGTYRLHGLDPAGLAPGSIEHIERSLSCYDPADRARVAEAFRRCVQEGAPYDLECGFTNVVGRRMRIRTMARAVRESGRILKIVGNLQDITAQKRAETELEFQAHLLRNIRDLVVATDLDGRITYISDGNCAMLGRSRAELMGTTVGTLGQDAGRGATQDEIVRRTREDGQWRGEVVNVAADGRTYLLDCRTQLIRDAGGRPYGMVGISTDITEWKKAEQNLKESEARFAALFRSSPMAAAITTIEDGRLVEVNAEFTRITGYRREESVGRAVLDLGLWADPAERAEIVRRAREKGAVHGIECRLRRSSGDVFPVLLSAETVRIGQVEYLLTMALDISQRKQAEEAQQREHRWLQFVVEGSRLGTWVWNVQTDETVFNETWAEMLGYALSELMPYSYATWERLVHPDDVVKAGERLRRCAAGEMSEYECEFRMRHKDGHWVWILDRGRVMTHDAAGAPLSMFGTHMDITERKRAEEALARSTALLRDVLDMVPAYICAKDSEGRFLLVNRRLADFYGMPVDTIVGMLHADLCEDEEELRAMLAADRRVMESGRPKVIPEETMQKPDGSIAVLETCKIPFTAGGTPAVLIAATDITERKRAEQALRESEERFRAANEASLDSILLLRSDRDERGEIRDFVVVDLNRRTEEILRMTRAQLLGRRLCETLPASREAGFFEKFKQVVETGVPLEEEFHLPETLLPAAWYYHQVVKVGDGVFVCHRDIGDRKRAEEERAKLQAQFLQAQKMESVGRLAGGVAHDFNNLLMGIMGYTDLCRDAIAPEHAIRPWLDEILVEVQRSANLVRQLLAFARKQTVAPRALDLNDAVGGMLKLLRRLIGEDIDLAWQPCVDIWPVMIDPGQVDQVLANLCVNARDAIGGVGKVTLETENVMIDDAFCAGVVEARPGPHVLLAVSDTGCGMDRETLDHIFEPFYTTKPVGEGTGLGLATVHGIVKQNAGFLSVHSEPGRGTTFRIYLPRHESADVPAPIPEEVSAPPRGSETVLLVEDEKSVRAITSLMLGHLGYTVLAAETTDEALRLAAAHAGAIHLLITDVVMPGMSGRDLADRITAVQPAVKCLFISGYTADVIAHRGILDEGIHFLAKPFARDDLARKVRDVLDGSPGGATDG